MPRVRELEGRDAGVIPRIIQRLGRLVLGQRLNPTKVQAHAPRAMVASFVSNMIFASGKWAIGRHLAHLVRLRVAGLNGCPF